MKKISINASSKYDVLVGQNILDDCNNLIENKQTAVIISDDNVFPLYGDRVKKTLAKNGRRVIEYVVKNGEGAKSTHVFANIMEFLASEGINKSDVLIALGGGVVGDLTGFCASCYLRGIDFVQIPTTFLAAIDSSVGGKTALNLSSGKNLVGAFYQPIAVLCDIDTFDTLEKQVFYDGLCEAVKYGCILDKDLYNVIAKGNLDKQTVMQIVTRCIELKRDIVEQDEFDKGQRQMLNFGHTAGHAIEKLSGFSISHGKAVAIGMCIMDKRVKEIFDIYGIDTKCKFDSSDLSNTAMSDKKRQGQNINIILLEEIGKGYIKKVDFDMLEKIFAKGIVDYGC